MPDTPDPGSQAPPHAAPSGISGRYGDGRTAAGRTATVTLGPDGVQLAFADTGETRSWVYAGLATAEPLGARSRNVLIRSETEPGATLYVDDPAFVAELSRRAGHLTTRAERWRYLRPALAVMVAIGLVGLAMWALDLSPTRAIARVVPERTWDAAGAQLSASFERDFPGCTEAPGKAALDKLVRRLSTAAGDNRPFTVHLANWDLVNAFAMPGRHLMLTRGLIRDAQTPEEVAGVLGHEMGHGLEHHPEAGIVRQLGLTVAMKLVFAGGSEQLGNIGGTLLLLRYTRQGEREADGRAFELLRKARISAKPLAGFFERMAKKEGSGSYSKIARKYEILSSHPALEERAATARAQPDYPTEPILTAQEWQDLRGVCKTPARSAPGEQPGAGGGKSP